LNVIMYDQNYDKNNSLRLPKAIIDKIYNGLIFAKDKFYQNFKD